MKAKKILCFICLILWLLGGVGGFGYAVYGGSWPIAIGAVANAVFAFGKVKEFWNIVVM